MVSSWVLVMVLLKVLKRGYFVGHIHAVMYNDICSLLWTDLLRSGAAAVRLLRDTDWILTLESMLFAVGSADGSAEPLRCSS